MLPALNACVTTMYPTSTFRRSTLLLRWVIVVLFLACPRVVGHRHIDIADTVGQGQALASHLKRHHGPSGLPVDDRELHFHLTLSLFEAGVPAGVPSSDGMLSKCDVEQTCSFELPQSACQCESNALWDVSDFPSDGPADGSIRHSASSFKRIYFSVWII
jgi:hypothetical protein